MSLPDVVAGNTGHITHHNVLHDWTQADDNVRFVSRSSSASDSNDGLSPFFPKASVQSAADSLQSLSKPGRIYLAAGRYDLGTAGLQLDRRYPIEFIGTHPRGYFASPTGATYPTGNTVFYTSSATPDDLVSFPNPVSLTNGYGFKFENIGFEMRSTIDRGLYGLNMNDVRVRNCGFWSDGNADAWGIVADHDVTHGDDHSWWRVEDCFAGNTGLFFGGPNQNNQHVIIGNKGIGGSTNGTVNVTNNPFVRLDDANRCLVTGNNVEHYKSLTYGGIYLAGTGTGCVGNELLANGGENTQYFYVLSNAKNTLITGMGSSAAAVTAGWRYVWFQETSVNRCRDNMVIAYVVGGSAYSWDADAIKDDTANKLNFWQVNGLDDTDNIREHLPWRYVDTGPPGSNTTLPATLRNGMLYQRTDGSGTTDNLYVRRGGAWVGIA